MEMGNGDGNGDVDVDEAPFPILITSETRCSTSCCRDVGIFSAATQYCIQFYKPHKNHGKRFHINVS